MIHDTGISIPEHVTDRPNSVDKGDVCNYLNAVTFKFGPFCEWCDNFDKECSWCNAGYRPREYKLELGPYETAFFRKQCKFFKEKEESEEERTGKEAEIARKVGNSIDCFVQQYC